MDEILIDWPTHEGIWMGNIPGDVGWFPLQTMALKDDLPPLDSYGKVPAGWIAGTLAIVAQWPESETSWPYLFKGNHPVTAWRRPTEDELKKAKHFYGIAA